MKTQQDLLEECSPSYMDLKIHVDQGDTLQLKVPTFWDDIRSIWIGAIKTPISKKLLYAEGKDSFELQNEFNRVLGEALNSGNEFSDEVFKMFKPIKQDDMD